MSGDAPRRKLDLTHSVILSAAGNLAGPIAGLASAPVLAHAVGVDGRGTVAAVCAPIMLAALVAGFGLPEATTYFVARSSSPPPGIRRRSALLAVVAAAVTSLAVALSASALLRDPAAARLLVVLAICTILPSVLVGVLRAHAAGRGQWGLVAIERSAAPVIRLVAFLVLDSMNRLDTGTAATVMVVVPLAAGAIYLCKRDGRRERAVTEIVHVRSLIGYSSRAWLGTLSGAVVMRLDQVIMAPLASPEQLGLYAVAVTVSEIPLVVTSAVREVVLTIDARRHDDATLARAARIATAASALTAANLCVSGVWWLPLLFGDGFSDALAPTFVLATAVVAGVPGSVAGAALNARGLPHLRSSSLCVAALVSTVLLIVLVPSGGALGGALATLGCNAVGGWMNVVRLVRRSSLRWHHFLVPTFSDLIELRALLHRTTGRATRTQ